MAGIVLVIDYDNRRIKRGSFPDGVVSDHGSCRNISHNHLERDHLKFPDKHGCIVNKADEVGGDTVFPQQGEESCRYLCVQTSFL